jgi:hypothetical protein
MRTFSNTIFRTASASRLCLALVLGLLASGTAVADTVAGRVYGIDEKPVANMTFRAKPAKGETVEFKTNANGAFSVYLDPGRYTVSPSNDPGVQGFLNSFPQPAQQDVRLKKTGT